MTIEVAYAGSKGTRLTQRFDGNAPGWVVYGRGSAHVPTVTGGEMLILYFLPGGAIEFE